MTMNWILVVEDEEDVSSFLRYVLESDSFNVETASSIAEAREILKHRVPDAVLLDRGLPDGDGLDLCREIKHVDGRKPPVLVLSSRKDSKEVKEGFDAGAVDYIVKPFQFVNVLARVRAQACA